MPVRTKRIYAEAAPGDGKRVLVDRLWPRGLSKRAAAVDAWLRELAPSGELRKWFHAHPSAWSTFRNRYLKELVEPPASRTLEELYRLAGEPKNITLLFASRDEERNNAVVLKDLLNGMRKPPTGTGPGAARSLSRRQARRIARIR